MAAVVSGGDAQRSHRARASAGGICQSLFALGYEPVLVELGMKTAGELLSTGAELVVDATLDGRVADGSLQELCATLDALYIGPPASACRASADKAICSALLAQAGIHVPRQQVLSRGSVYRLDVDAALPSIARALGPRVIVKPRYGNAGLGVRAANGLEGIADAIHSAFNHDESVVIESAISGRECTVLLSGVEGELWAIGVADVIYDDGEDTVRSASWARNYKPTALIGADRLQAITATARRAAHALGCAGLAKVDLIVDEKGTPWVFDVDCTVDWSPGGWLTACLISNQVTEPQLMAALLAQASMPARRAA